MSDDSDRLERPVRLIHWPPAAPRCPPSLLFSWVSLKPFLIVNKKTFLSLLANGTVWYCATIANSSISGQASSLLESSSSLTNPSTRNLGSCLVSELERGGSNSSARSSVRSNHTSAVSPYCYLSPSLLAETATQEHEDLVSPSLNARLLFEVGAVLAAAGAVAALFKRQTANHRTCCFFSGRFDQSPPFLSRRSPFPEIEILFVGGPALWLRLRGRPDRRQTQAAAAAGAAGGAGRWRWRCEQEIPRVSRGSRRFGVLAPSFSSFPLVFW